MKEVFLVVMNVGGFPMHERFGPNYFPSKVLGYRLMSEANTENGDSFCKSSDDL